MKNNFEETNYDKKNLRKYIQKKRDSLSLKERNKKSKKVAENFFKVKYYTDSKNILIFYPFRSEIDTTIIIKDALRKGKKIILPRVSDNQILELYYVNNLTTQLKKGSFGIMEPIPSLCRACDVKSIDLAVIPGLGFDRNLNRLGYGGGFYDKLLSELPENIKKIALGFKAQILPFVPAGKFDKKPDILVTESKIYYSKEKYPDKSNSPVNKKLAILIPAYNEEKYIEKVIKECFEYNIDIIVVDDGSTDNTSSIVESITSKKSLINVILLKHLSNRGKGEALKTGFNYAVKNNYYGVITIDADGQHKASEIASFINSVEKVDPDIIVGSRFKNIKGMPFDRLFTNFFTSWLISLIAGKKIEDVQSGFRYLSTEVLKNIKLETKNFDTEPEILLRASWQGYGIKNIPISTIYFKGFKSSINPLKDTVKFFKLVLVSLYWKRQYKKHKIG